MSIYIYIYNVLLLYIIARDTRAIFLRDPFIAIKRLRICCPLFIDLPGGGRKRETGLFYDDTNESRFLERFKNRVALGERYDTRCTRESDFFFSLSHEKSFSNRVVVLPDMINIALFRIKFYLKMKKNEYSRRR